MDRLAATWDSVVELIANPTANLTASVLILAAITLVLLILALGALLWVMSAGTSKRSTAATVDVGEEAIGAGAARRRPALVFAIVLLVASFVSGFVLTGQDEYCLSCHQDVAEVLSVESTETPAPSRLHADASCVDCHEVPPWPLGFLTSATDRIVHSVTGVLVAEQPRTPVLSETCIRCHEEIVEGVVEIEARGLRISHTEPLEAGMTCTECHRGADPHVALDEGPGMATCVRCHDGETAPAGCDGCHSADTALAGEGRLFPAQRLAKVNDCSGCHPQDTCDACHGLRMPHTQTFSEYDHARYAGFDKKELCWRCHTIGDCDKCHETKEGIWGHGSDDAWIVDHQMQGHPNPGGCGCHSASPYVREQGDFCIACH